MDLTSFLTFLTSIVLIVAHEVTDSTNHCPKNWTLLKQTQTCLRFYNNAQYNFSSARRLCQHPSGGLSFIKTYKELIEIIKTLGLTNRTIKLWNSGSIINDLEGSNLMEIQSNGTKESPHCTLFSVVNSKNISLFTVPCSYTANVVCMYSSVPPITVVVPDKHEMETRDYMAIAVGVTIAAVFCAVVLVDIARYYSVSHRQNYKVVPI